MTDYSGYEHILCERPEDGILKLTINNPENLNAIAPPIHTELARIWIDIADDPDTRCVLLTGAGRAFSAGGDVKNMVRTWGERDVAAALREAKQIVDRMMDTPQPIIAMVNGHAIGLGATLALNCDIVFAAEGARIGDRHVNVGLVAGDGGALLWPLLIGPHRAKQYLLTGQLLTGAEAAELGLINQAVEARGAGDGRDGDGAAYRRAGATRRALDQTLDQQDAEVDRQRLIRDLARLRRRLDDEQGPPGGCHRDGGGTRADVSRPPRRSIRLLLLTAGVPASETRSAGDRRVARQR